VVLAPPQDDLAEWFAEQLRVRSPMTHLVNAKRSSKPTSGGLWGSKTRPLAVTWDDGLAMMWMLAGCVAASAVSDLCSGGRLAGSSRPFVAHYNGARPHRSLDLRPPRLQRPTVDLGHERIRRRPILGGLINEYERAA
jgi:hypothetical protein